MVIRALVNGQWQEAVLRSATDGEKVAISEAYYPNMYAVSLDCGRKYFTIGFMKSLIDWLATLGFDALFLHFSEDMGFRIESKLYPWLAGSDVTLCPIQGVSDYADEGKYWTQDEVRTIVSYAMNHGIEIIPSFDCPAHLNYVVKQYYLHNNVDIGNYFHYNGQTANIGNPYPRGIDISNSTAITFIESLYTEMAELFYTCGCRRFDIGGDELLGWGSAVVSTSTAPRWQQLDHWKSAAITATGNNSAVAYDYFLAFMNNMHSLLKGIGYKEVFMWCDQALRASDTGWSGVVTLDKDITILYWTNVSPNTPLTFMQAGHSIINCYERNLYYVLKESYVQPTVSSLTGWNKSKYSGYTASAHESKNKGGMFCIWCDNPTLETETEILNHVKPLLNAMIS